MFRIDTHEKITGMELERMLLDVATAPIAALDAADPIAGLRAAFRLPKSKIYLDGNSLGALPASAPTRINRVVEQEWGEDLIDSWNKNGWIGMPQRVGDRIAQLIGAGPGEVVAADSTSVNLLKLLSCALSLRPERRVILSDSGNFPNDLYIAQGLAALLERDHELRVVAPEEVADAIDEELAVLLLTDVDYRTGRRHNMTKLTARAHAAGALTIWDLCHSAGAIDVDLNSANADLAVGCGYKYLNGGPGAPGFMFVAARHQSSIRPAVSGWMGHERPFEFDLEYRPAEGIARNLAGTPAIIGLTVLESSLDIFERTDMHALRGKSIALGNLFIELFDEKLASLGLELVTPRLANERGSQISLRHPQGYAIMQALIARGVIGDFRAPDILRFGLTPLYTRFADVEQAVLLLEEIIVSGAWRAPAYSLRKLVT